MGFVERDASKMTNNMKLIKDDNRIDFDLDAIPFFLFIKFIGR